MKILPFVFIYLILVSFWCILFYQFIAPVKDPQLILLLFTGSLFYSLIWGIFVSLFQRIVGWKGYGMLLIPVAIMIIFFLGINRSNFLFIGGLILVSELVSLAKIVSHNRKKGN
jgi:hypothetical protein